MNSILIQFIGGIGYATLAASYFKKKKKQILFMQIIAYVLFTIHYYLLSGITGAICNAIGLVALLIIYLFEKFNWKHKNFMAWIMVGILLVINIVTFQNIYSIFPMIASTIVIISFLMENEDYIRGVGLISAVCWLIYAIAYKSYVAMAFEVITLVGVIFAFIKNTSNPKISFK